MKINLPYNLQDGQKSSAPKVMANFQAVLNWANAGAGSLDVDVEGMESKDVEAALAELLAGILDRYTKEQADTLLAEHTDRTDNPHEVTSAQTAYDGAVSGLSVDNAQEALDEVAITARTAETVAAQAQRTADRAVGEKFDKPYNLNSAKVGAVYGLQVHVDRTTSLVEGGPGPGPSPEPEVLVGAIIMWGGEIEDIPEGYALCDGQNGTPDLTDRFVVGAGNSYLTGSIGGSEAVALNQNQMPAHTHIPSLNTSSDNAHTHNMTSASAASSGAHTHTMARSSGSASSDVGVYYGSYGGTSAAISISSAGAHTHSISSASAASAGAHAHTVSGTLSSIGSNEAHENRPPYYALAFIMCIREQEVA